ncbi:class I SAM-dependent methyltransferase [uncultured Brachybacterium sp.]|uniref:class I SAM-dependent methyltransferase n=1 Tax=uncultured Brachybacterium sp. TaxID=189680 RepID=UPI00261B67C6|nr:methyltransferase [uncultured Brachybacterium sp.]
MPKNPAADPFDDDAFGEDLFDEEPRDAQPAASAPQGPDQTDRVIIAAAEELGTGCPCDMIVVDDATGELTAFALASVAEHEDAVVLSWTSSLTLAMTLQERFAAQIDAGRLRLPAGPETVPLEEAAAGVEGHLLVLMRLPKAVHALEDRARRLTEAVRASGQNGLSIIAGGRVKHMTRAQNDVLATLFTEVRASRGIGKSRALIGSELREVVPAPAIAEGTARVAVRGQRRELALRGIGAVFGGAGADAGSRLLLDALDRAVAAGELGTSEAPVGSAVDLGCGNGLMTAYLAAALPEAAVTGSDADADAVGSTRATLAANRLDREGVEVTWDDVLSRVDDASVDLVLLNPPFHDGTAVDATLVQGLLDAAARVLRPGGQLWFVHNSYLRYRTEVERRVGPVRQRSRDRRFTVLSATRS